MDFTNFQILVTGGAGFIGSHLAERLFALGASVKVLDNFATGKRANLASFADHKRFRLIEGDIRDSAVCREAVAGCDFVLHEAALGSVPRSLEDPLTTWEVNAGGFANMIVAARDAGVKRFIYASSSSVYGDDPSPVKREDRLGTLLSPYAVSKRANELFALNFSKVYGFETIGLRYFNVFGPRQDPNGPYAAVIPKFIEKLLKLARPVINGDGSFSRDFTYVANVVDANLLALTAPGESANTVYNIAYGERTILAELFELIKAELKKVHPAVAAIEAEYGMPRTGDIPHSSACIDKARSLLKYSPEINLPSGLARSVEWYFKYFR